MGQYIFRRIVASLPVLVGVLLVTFALARMIPGGPCVAMLGEKATQAACARFDHEKGFDRPIPVQLGFYIRDVVTGDLGTSIRFNRAVTQLIVERLPLTVELGIVALVIATLVGIPAGVISAIRRNSAIDIATMIGANIGVSMPVFWLGLMLAYIFALVLKGTPFALPPSGRLSSGVASIPFYEVWNLKLTPGTMTFTILDFLSRMNILNGLLSTDFKLVK